LLDVLDLLPDVLALAVPQFEEPARQRLGKESLADDGELAGLSAVVGDETEEDQRVADGLLPPRSQLQHLDQHHVGVVLVEEVLVEDPQPHTVLLQEPQQIYV
jgi:hypothetical protein